jgi:hypothetical protein
MHCSWCSTEYLYFYGSKGLEPFNSQVLVKLIQTNLVYYLRFKRFREGDFSLKDISRSGRPLAIDPKRLQALIEGWFIAYI